uniref:Uncharacterized protein n=1 Tax=Chloracidobacterium thermophilum TaxID=458033 RepID=A8DJS5_9BACT|nr:hypothetical protein YS_M60-F11.168 [Chloracidobacterium thermophilum]
MWTHFFHARLPKGSSCLCHVADGLVVSAGFGDVPVEYLVIKQFDDK